MYAGFGLRSVTFGNSFPDSLQDPTLNIDNFRSALKTPLFAVQWDT